MTAFRSNVDVAPTMDQPTEAGWPRAATDRPATATMFRRAVAALSADPAASEAARRHGAEAAAALIAQADADDPRLSQFLRPDPADAASVTWTVACYQIGDLSPSALRDFSDAFEAVRVVARCPDAAHVAAELIVSTPSGLHWTAMIRTGEIVRFQLLDRSTGSDSASTDHRQLDAAQARWADQLARWAIDPDEPGGVGMALQMPSTQTGPSVPAGVDSAVILGQILEAVRGLSERVDALEGRLANLPLQLGITALLASDEPAPAELPPPAPPRAEFLTACRQAAQQSLTAAYTRGRAATTRWRTNVSIPPPDDGSWSA